MFLLLFTFCRCCRCLSRFRALGPVFGTALPAAVYACGIQGTPYNVITYTGKVFYTASAHQYDGVLLEVVSFARNVGVYLFLVGKAHTGYLTQGRIRLFGRRGVHTRTHPTTLRAGV